MSKAKKVAVTPEAGMEVAATETPVAVQQKLQVKTGVVYRGARLAWYELACKYDGKTVAEFLAAAAEIGTVSAYTTRSKHAGNPHNAQGYLRGLVRRGSVTLV